MSEVKITVDTKELDRIISHLDINVDDAGFLIASEIEAEAKAIAPYQTGALKNSIYTRGKRKSTQPAQMAEKTYYDLPAPSGNVRAIVGPSVDYAAYVEFGTYKMAARPYLSYALQHVIYSINNGSYFEGLLK